MLGFWKNTLTSVLCVLVAWSITSVILIAGGSAICLLCESGTFLIGTVAVICLMLSSFFGGFFAFIKASSVLETALGLTVISLPLCVFALLGKELPYSLFWALSVIPAGLIGRLLSMNIFRKNKRHRRNRRR